MIIFLASNDYEKKRKPNPRIGGFRTAKQTRNNGLRYKASHYTIFVC